MLFEWHATTSVYLRAVSLNQPTMEVYRGLGLHDAIGSQAAPPTCHELTAWYTSFAGPNAAARSAPREPQRLGRR
jgi:2,4-dichlorophenol 6-monooxygenase